MFRTAIVRAPSPNFADGVTRENLGPPDYATALSQHAQYCTALERCGLNLIRLAADPRHPDATFVEDTAVLLPRCRVITRPGAESRRGEVDAIRASLLQQEVSLDSITAPGTVDGGDICEAGDHVFIGLSARTNQEGAAQLAALLESSGYDTSFVDIRNVDGILHLKSGLSWLGDGRLLVIDALAHDPAFAHYERVCAESDEAYAANAVRVNDYVLLATGYRRTAARLRELGYALIELDMSEFRKMDGGLSCLSLRY
ncbi:MAG: dimethylargininase [Rhodanobacteraceae bacterium]|nr:dimethylargininase [Rhodanobacteraceae bacterium]